MQRMTVEIDGVDGDFIPVANVRLKAVYWYLDYTSTYKMGIVGKKPPLAHSTSSYFGQYLIYPLLHTYSLEPLSCDSY